MGYWNVDLSAILWVVGVTAFGVAAVRVGVWYGECLGKRRSEEWLRAVHEKRAKTGKSRDNVEEG